MSLIDAVAKKLIAKSGKDIFVHSGDMMPPACDEMLRLARRPRRKQAYLFVCTYGGYAKTAYRIMRCLRHAYEQVTVVVAGPCKSAGTLLVIGADEVVMDGAAELGPLDVQIIKTDELIERQSGLATDFAFGKLRAEALDAFRKTFLDLKIGGKLTTATAASTAAEFAVGLFSPVYAQIDPLRIGEVSMANLVAREYAIRLTKHEGQERANISEEGIGRLLMSYPSHDFAIDRTEAKEIFSCVRHMTDDEHEFVALLGHTLTKPVSPAITLKVEPREPEKDQDQDGKGNDDAGKPVKENQDSDEDRNKESPDGEKEPTEPPDNKGSGGQGAAEQDSQGSSGKLGAGAKGAKSGKRRRS
jgi:hypothetical protein